MGTLHEDRHTFLIISHSVLLGMRNVPDKSYRENQNTHFVFSNFFFKNRLVCEIIRKNIVEPLRPQMTIWHMCNACWTTKATNTLRLYNAHCFSTTKTVARTRLAVTLYVRCLACHDSALLVCDTIWSGS